VSTRWEALAGDTSRFALKMSFIADSSEIPIAAEMAASWGSFEIWVNGANLCAHVEEGETVEAVHWYLLPLLEWLASNWNPMLHEERPPVRNAGEDAVSSLYRTRFASATLSKERALEHEMEWYAWRQRHGLHAAREGGLFPELYLRRWADQVEVSWSNRPPPGTPEGFSFLVAHGRALLPPDDVAGAVYAVMRAAVEQLQAERVRRVIADSDEPIATASGVRHVADTFGTSPRATLEHLHNLGFVDEFERELLRGTGLSDETFGGTTLEFGG
jgi:hypothetical protein